MAYPSTLSNITNPNASDKLNSPSHSALHTSENTAITELQTFVGTLASTAGTLIYDIRATASDGGGHVQGVNKGGTGFTSYTKGNILVASSSSVLSKLAVGTDGLALVADSASPAGVAWSQVVGNFSGSGVDGDVTISNDTTLTANKYYNSLTISSTKTLNTGGYAIYVAGTVTNDRGIIQNNGGNGVNGSVSATLPTTSPGGIGGASAAGVTFAKSAPGVDGGSGSTGATSNSSDGISKSPSLGVAGSKGGRGGGTSGTTGAAGSIVAESLTGTQGFSPSVFNANSVASTSNAFIFKGTVSSLLLSTSASGSGGTGGQGDGGNQQGGGGGGSGGAGGVVVIVAKSIINTGSIIAKGGDGGAGGNGSGSAYAGGGGAGGPGGVVILAYRTLTDTGTIAAPGGAAGAAGTGGAGAGNAGSVGGVGNVYKVQIV